MNTSTATISEVERFELTPAAPLVGGIPALAPRAGWSAIVTLPSGVCQVVSRLDGEQDWIIDGIWTRSSDFPKFWNGRGSRCTRLVAVTDVDVEHDLNRAVAAEATR